MVVGVGGALLLLELVTVDVAVAVEVDVRVRVWVVRSVEDEDLVGLNELTRVVDVVGAALSVVRVGAAVVSAVVTTVVVGRRTGSLGAAVVDGTLGAKEADPFSGVLVGSGSVDARSTSLTGLTGCSRTSIGAHT